MKVGYTNITSSIPMQAMNVPFHANVQFIHPIAKNNATIGPNELQARMESGEGECTRGKGRDS